MRLGYELSNGSTVLTAVSLHRLSTTEAVRNIPTVTALSWSFLYDVQDSLLLENLPVITE